MATLALGASSAPASIVRGASFWVPFSSVRAALKIESAPAASAASACPSSAACTASTRSLASASARSAGSKPCAARSPSAAGVAITAPAHPMPGCPDITEVATSSTMESA